LAKHDFTPEQLAALTDEEREGLEDDSLVDDPEDDAGDGDADDDADDLPSDKAEKPADKADADKPKPEEGKDDEGDDEQETPPAKVEKPADPAADEPGAEADDEPAAAPPPSPYKAPEGAKDRIKAIDDELDQVASKFDDGELTAREMREQERKLRDERENLSKELMKEEFSVDQHKAEWGKQVASFLETNPAYAEHPARLQLLDFEVRKLQAESGHQYDPAHLRKAHATVLKGLGIAETPTPKPRIPTTTGQKRPDPPPTLAHVPAADIEDTDEGARFSYLDRLSGTEYEAALAKLSDADREAYLTSQ
jgi:hypothetical protein